MGEGEDMGSQPGPPPSNKRPLDDKVEGKVVGGGGGVERWPGEGTAAASAAALADKGNEAPSHVT